MIKPNIHRVLVRPIKLEGITASSGIVLPGQQKPGENLLYGVVVEPGNTEFKVNQEIFYSEYSSAAIIDARKMVEGEVNQEPLVIVAEDDIMAYYDDVRKVSEIIKEDRPETKTQG